jgi:hypothetical protein
MAYSELVQEPALLICQDGEAALQRCFRRREASGGSTLTANSDTPWFEIRS